MENLKTLKQLVEIKSYDTSQNKEIIDFLERQFKTNSKEVLRIKNKGDKRENLIVGINTNLKDVSNAIVLSGHIDTVMADEFAYITNPYKATIIDGKMYGLGVIDMKSYFACILNNICRLKQAKAPIIVAISGDEETTLEGVTNIVQKLKQLNIKPRLTIVGEPTDGKVCTTSKSCFEYQIDIVGRGCHSSAPQNGINANYVSARIMLFIEKLCGKIKNTTLSCNLMSGGQKVNIVSPTASLKFDVRSDCLKSKDKALKLLNGYLCKLKRKYGADISIKENLMIPALENKASKQVASIISTFCLKETEFRGGCEAGYYQALGGDAIVFGVGDLNLAHKPNEFVEIADFEKYSKLFMQIIDKI